MPRKAKKITQLPKRVVDRELALALQDYKKDRLIGPFRTAKAAVQSLRRAAKMRMSERAARGSKAKALRALEVIREAARPPLPEDRPVSPRESRPDSPRQSRRHRL